MTHELTTPSHADDETKDSEDEDEEDIGAAEGKKSPATLNSIRSGRRSKKGVGGAGGGGASSGASGGGTKKRDREEKESDGIRIMNVEII